MERLERTKHVTLRLEMGLLEQIPKSQSKTAFIKNAIKNELVCSHNSTKEFNQFMKKIEKFDCQDIMAKVVNLELTLQILFEEIKKHGEVLKLVLRRSTMASSFAGFALDELKRSNLFRLEEYKEILSQVEKEAEQIGI